MAGNTRSARSGRRERAAEEPVLQKIEDGTAALRYSLRPQRIAAQDFAEHGRGGEIENRHGDDGEDCVVRINGPELPRIDALSDGLSQVLVQRTKVLACDPRQALAAVHHFALDQARVVGVAGDEIKIAVYVGQQLLLRRGLVGAGDLDGAQELAEQKRQHEAVQVLFAPEVVVEQGLVHPGGGRDLVGAGAGQAALGEDGLGGGNNAPHRCRVLGLLEAPGDLDPQAREPPSLGVGFSLVAFFPHGL